MLYQANDETIEEHWDKLYDLLALTMPADSAERKEYYKELIKRKMLFLYVGVRDEKIVGALLLSIVVDAIAMAKNLLVFAAYTPSNLTKAEVSECFSDIRNIGKAFGADNVCFYTANDKLVRWATQFKPFQRTYILFPLGE